MIYNKFLTIKAKYNVIEPHYMEGTTPEVGSFLGTTNSKEEKQYTSSVAGLKVHK